MARRNDVNGALTGSPVDGRVAAVAAEHEAWLSALFPPLRNDEIGYSPADPAPLIEPLAPLTRRGDPIDANIRMLRAFGALGPNEMPRWRHHADGTIESFPRIVFMPRLGEIRNDIGADGIAIGASPSREVTVQVQLRDIDDNGEDVRAKGLVGTQRQAELRLRMPIPIVPHTAIYRIANQETAVPLSMGPSHGGIYITDERKPDSDLQRVKPRYPMGYERTLTIKAQQRSRYVLQMDLSNPNDINDARIWVLDETTLERVRYWRSWADLASDVDAAKRALRPGRDPVRLNVLRTVLGLREQGTADGATGEIVPDDAGPAVAELNALGAARVPELRGRVRDLSGVATLMAIARWGATRSAPDDIRTVLGHEPEWHAIGNAPVRRPAAAVAAAFGRVATDALHAALTDPGRNRMLADRYADPDGATGNLAGYVRLTLGADGDAAMEDPDHEQHGAVTVVRKGLAQLLDHQLAHSLSGNETTISLHAHGNPVGNPIALLASSVRFIKSAKRADVGSAMASEAIGLTAADALFVTGAAAALSGKHGGRSFALSRSATVTAHQGAGLLLDNGDVMDLSTAAGRLHRGEPIEGLRRGLIGESGPDLARDAAQRHRNIEALARAMTEPILEARGAPLVLDGNGVSRPALPTTQTVVGMGTSLNTHEDAIAVGPDGVTNERGGPIETTITTSLRQELPGMNLHRMQVLRHGVWTDGEFTDAQRDALDVEAEANEGREWRSVASDAMGITADELELLDESGRIPVGSAIGPGAPLYIWRQSDPADGAWYYYLARAGDRTKPAIVTDVSQASTRNAEGEDGPDQDGPLDTGRQHLTIRASTATSLAETKPTDGNSGKAMGETVLDQADGPHGRLDPWILPDGTEGPRPSMLTDAVAPLKRGEGGQAWDMSRGNALLSITTACRVIASDPDGERMPTATQAAIARAALAELHLAPPADLRHLSGEAEGMPEGMRGRSLTLGEAYGIDPTTASDDELRAAIRAHEAGDGMRWELPMVDTGDAEADGRVNRATIRRLRSAIPPAWRAPPELYLGAHGWAHNARWRATGGARTMAFALSTMNRERTPIAEGLHQAESELGRGSGRHADRTVEEALLSHGFEMPTGLTEYEGPLMGRPLSAREIRTICRNRRVDPGAVRGRAYRENGTPTPGGLHAREIFGIGRHDDARRPPRGEPRWGYIELGAPLVNPKALESEGSTGSLLEVLTGASDEQLRRTARRYGPVTTGTSRSILAPDGATRIDTSTIAADPAGERPNDRTVVAANGPEWLRGILRQIDGAIADDDAYAELRARGEGQLAAALAQVPDEAADDAAGDGESAEAANDAERAAAIARRIARNLTERLRILDYARHAQDVRFENLVMDAVPVLPAHHRPGHWDPFEGHQPEELDARYAALATARDVPAVARAGAALADGLNRRTYAKAGEVRSRKGKPRRPTSMTLSLANPLTPHQPPHVVGVPLDILSGIGGDTAYGSRGEAWAAIGRAMGLADDDPLQDGIAIAHGARNPVAAGRQPDLHNGSFGWGLPYCVELTYEAAEDPMVRLRQQVELHAQHLVPLAGDHDGDTIHLEAFAGSQGHQYLASISSFELVTLKGWPSIAIKEATCELASQPAGNDVVGIISVIETAEDWAWARETLGLPADDRDFGDAGYRRDRFMALLSRGLGPLAERVAQTLRPLPEWEDFWTKPLTPGGLSEICTALIRAEPPANGAYRSRALMALGVMSSIGFRAPQRPLSMAAEHLGAVAAAMDRLRAIRAGRGEGELLALSGLTPEDVAGLAAHGAGTVGPSVAEWELAYDACRVEGLRERRARGEALSAEEAEDVEAHAAVPDKRMHIAHASRNAAEAQLWRDVAHILSGREEDPGGVVAAAEEELGNEWGVPEYADGLRERCDNLLNHPGAKGMLQLISHSGVQRTVADAQLDRIGTRPLVRGKEYDAGTRSAESRGAQATAVADKAMIQQQGGLTNQLLLATRRRTLRADDDSNPHTERTVPVPGTERTTGAAKTPAAKVDDWRAALPPGLETHGLEMVEPATVKLRHRDGSVETRTLEAGTRLTRGLLTAMAAASDEPEARDFSVRAIVEPVSRIAYGNAIEAGRETAEGRAAFHARYTGADTRANGTPLPPLGMLLGRSMIDANGDLVPPTDEQLARDPNAIARVVTVADLRAWAHGECELRVRTEAGCPLAGPHGTGPSRAAVGAFADWGWVNERPPHPDGFDVDDEHVQPGFPPPGSNPLQSLGLSVTEGPSQTIISRSKPNQTARRMDTLPEGPIDAEHSRSVIAQRLNDALGVGGEIRTVIERSCTICAGREGAPDGTGPDGLERVPSAGPYPTAAELEAYIGARMAEVLGPEQRLGAGAACAGIWARIMVDAASSPHPDRCPAMGRNDPKTGQFRWRPAEDPVRRTIADLYTTGARHDPEGKAGDGRQPQRQGEHLTRPHHMGPDRGVPVDGAAHLEGLAPALHWAAVSGDQATLEDLLTDAGTDVDGEDAMGLTAVAYAATPEALATLVDAGADAARSVRARDEEYASAVDGTELATDRGYRTASAAFTAFVRDVQWQLANTPAEYDANWTDAIAADDDGERLEIINATVRDLDRTPRERMAERSASAVLDVGMAKAALAALEGATEDTPGAVSGDVLRAEAAGIRGFIRTHEARRTARETAAEAALTVPGPETTQRI